MKITWKDALLIFLLGIFGFIVSLESPQPYRMYVGLLSMVQLFGGLALFFMADVQKTGRNWKKFEKLKEDKDFVNYIETEFEKIQFNFNFKSQMVLGSKDINSRMASCDEMKEVADNVKK